MKTYLEAIKSHINTQKNNEKKSKHYWHTDGNEATRKRYESSGSKQIGRDEEIIIEMHP